MFRQVGLEEPVGYNEKEIDEQIRKEQRQDPNSKDHYQKTREDLERELNEDMGKLKKGQDKAFHTIRKAIDAAMERPGDKSIQRLYFLEGEGGTGGI